MVFKLTFTVLTLFFAVQVLSGPVQLQTDDIIGKGLFTDIHAAIVAVEEFILSCSALYHQIVTSSSNIITTFLTSANSIIKQLADLGLEPEELQKIQDLVVQCVVDIEAVVQGILADISNIISLVKSILSNLGNPILVGRDIIKLQRAIEKLKTDFASASDRIFAQLIELKDSILQTLVNHTGEIVDNIKSDIAAVEETINNEYKAIVVAIEVCTTAAAKAIEALNKIFS